MATLTKLSLAFGFDALSETLLKLLPSIAERKRIRTFNSRRHLKLINIRCVAFIVLFTSLLLHQSPNLLSPSIFETKGQLSQS